MNPFHRLFMHARRKANACNAPQRPPVAGPRPSDIEGVQIGICDVNSHEYHANLLKDA